MGKLKEFCTDAQGNIHLEYLTDYFVYNRGFREGFREGFTAAEILLSPEEKELNDSAKNRRKIRGRIQEDIRYL